MFKPFQPRTFGNSEDVLFHCTVHHTKQGMDLERTFFLRASPPDLEGTEVTEDTLGIVLNSLGIHAESVTYMTLVRVNVDLAKVSALSIEPIK